MVCDFSPDRRRGSMKNGLCHTKWIGSVGTVVTKQYPPLKKGCVQIG